MKKTYPPTAMNPPGELPKNYDKQVEQFVIAGTTMINHPKTRDGIIQQLQNQQDPIEGLKNVTLNIINAIEGKAKNNGKFVDPLVVAQAGPQLFAQIAAIGNASKALLTDEKQQQIALAAGVQEYIGKAVGEGRVKKEEVEKGAGELAQKYPKEVESFKQLMEEYRGGLENGAR